MTSKGYALPRQGGVLKRGNLVWLLWTAAAVAGCDSASPAPVDTGAREVVQRYCEALQQRDWTRAYATLHPDSRGRCSQEQFARRAARYRRELGFEPEPVQVRFCQEQRTRAVAHIVWKGQKAAHERFYKDAVVLRQMQPGWGVILPRNFGGGPLR